MVMPLGRDSDGTWVAADLAERDAIGTREAARVNDRCRIPGNDAIYRALTVPGLDTSTWTAGDWVMDSLTLSGNLTLDSPSPTATFGDGNGAPVALFRKQAASETIVKFFRGASVVANDKRLIHNADETWEVEHHNGTTWDTALQIDNSANVSQPRDSPVKTLGGGGGSPVDVIQKTAAGTGERKWRVGTSDAANDKREIHNSSEELVGQSHNGASWDTGYFLDNNADFNVTGQLLVAGALAADAASGATNVIIGDGGGSYGLTIFSDTNSVLNMTDESGQERGVIRYDHGSERFELEANGSYFLNMSVAAVWPNTSGGPSLGLSGKNWESLYIEDGVTAPGTPSAGAVLYVDTADGDLKVKFSDGFVAVIAADS